MNIPYLYLGDKQTASKSDLASAINDLIDNFVLTDTDNEQAIQILKDNSIAFE